MVLILFIPLFLSSNATDLYAASFGKNSVQYTYFDWKYLTTEHFDIYYNQGGREIADFAAEVAEEAYRKIASSINYSSDSDEPITLITYKSHNDFEQTNVSSHPDESTGGLTEFLKSRMVLPFQGDHEAFRHVIHHELTHAMMLNLLYGRGFGAIVSGISRSRVPLWFTEGLAEYHSRGGLDPETEMYLRDAIVNDILPDIYELNSYGYLGVYKCGQSILYWIAWRYGDEKIGEILHQIRRLHDFDRALKASIGITREELFKRWRRFVKERYWVQVANMEPPDKFSRQLTFHKKEYCYVNNSPSISPNGQWLAFLSNRSDYFDIFLMNTLNGEIVSKIVSGQRSGQFEELHWLRPGISWSPDGKSISLCAKAGEHDALYIISVPDGEILAKYLYDADALFSPSWAPSGNSIALIRIKDGKSDIAMVDPITGEMELLTDDIYDDADPSWSSDSRKLLFVSNRDGNWGKDKDLNVEEYVEFEYANNDIYSLDLENEKIERITHDSFAEETPIWTETTDKILYVSDKSGVSNLYVHDLQSGESSALTNVVTGISQPTYARNINTLAFTSYFDHGFDIFSVNDPLSLPSNRDIVNIPTAEVIPKQGGVNSNSTMISENLSHYIFDRLFSEDDNAAAETKDSSEIVIRMRNETGKYPSKDYSVKLEPDLVFINASYSPYFLMQGSGQIVFSDVLGNHKLFVSANLNRSVKYSNLFFMYQYLARRIDYGTGVYHYANPFYRGNVAWLDRNWGIFTTASYPLDRFNRLEFSVDYTTIERSVLDEPDGDSNPNLTLASVLPHVGYVHDTSIWGTSTEPTNGGRWRIDAQFSPNIGEKTNSGRFRGIDFQTYSADWRRYFVFHKDYSFSVRFNGGLSNGTNPQRFFMGGMVNWFNSRFDNATGDVQIDIHDIYFSRFITPMRGVGYYNQIGTRYLLTNLEFRFPFIRHLMFGWPLPAYFRNIRGAWFYDLGTAWEPVSRDTSMAGRLIDGVEIPKPGEWVNGIGFGIRLDLGIFPIEWDVAWSPETGMVPQYYFSLNLGF